MQDFRHSLIYSTLRKVLKRLHYPLEVMQVCARWYVVEEGKCVTARIKGRQDIPKAARVLAFKGVTVNVSPQSGSEGKCVTVPGLESPCCLGLFSR